MRPPVSIGRREEGNARRSRRISARSVEILLYSGACRYIINSPSIKIVLVRSLVTAMIGGRLIALMPLVARDLLHGGARTYGIMLSAFGLGAVIGALNITKMHKRMSGEAASAPARCRHYGSGAERRVNIDRAHCSLRAHLG